MEIVLTDEARAGLEEAAASEPRVRYWERYRAVPLVADGLAPPAVAAALGCAESSVDNWASRGAWTGTGPLVRTELAAAGYDLSARTVRRSLHRLGNRSSDRLFAANEPTAQAWQRNPGHTPVTMASDHWCDQAASVANIT